MFHRLEEGADGRRGARRARGRRLGNRERCVVERPRRRPSASGSAMPAFTGPAHGTAAHEDAEKPVTGDAAAKAQAAAVKLVGSGTAGAVTTDLPGTGYETTVTKSDGSTVEVHLDSSFNAFRGPGGPGRHRPRPAAEPDRDA